MGDVQQQRDDNHDTPEADRLEELRFLFDAYAAIDNITTEDADIVQDQFIDYWCEPRDEGVSLHDWALFHLGIRTQADRESLTFDRIETLSKYRSWECMKMLMIMKKTGRCRTGEDRETIARPFVAFKQAYELCKIHIMSTFVSDRDQFTKSNLPSEVTYWRLNFIHRNIKDFNPTQQIICTALDRLSSAGYRRFETDCYKEIKGSNGFGTHAWKRVCDIKEFIYEMIQKDQNALLWETATSQNSLVPATVDYLTNCIDIEFPPLKPDRHLFSFRNGQFDSVSITWHTDDPTDHSGTPLENQNRVSVRYFDCDFDASVLCQDYRLIDTSLFDSIFEHQDYDIHTIDRVYMMLGRLLFNVNESDNWQVAPFFKGVAGCGKSTVAAIVSFWYPPAFISTISCNMETGFGLANLLGTFMTWCTEVTVKFPLNRGVWQSMVTGEPVVVPRKNKSAIQEAWTVPMAMAGNELFGYEDKSQSVHRRTVIFPMKKSVPSDKADPGLLQKLKDDPGPLLVKCASAYRYWHIKCGQANFWAGPDEEHCDPIWVSTPQMKAWHNDLLVEIDIITSFFRGAETLKFDEDEYVMESDLKKHFATWLTDNGQTKDKIKEWTVDHMSSIYQNAKPPMLCMKETLEYPRDGGKYVSAVFIKGVCIVEEGDLGQAGGFGDGVAMSLDFSDSV